MQQAFSKPCLVNLISKDTHIVLLSLTVASYPSGYLAILISSFRPGQYQYIIHQDLDTSEVLADFEPNGYGYCNYQNGALR